MNTLKAAKARAAFALACVAVVAGAALALAACGGAETAQAPSSLPARTTPAPWITMDRLPSPQPTKEAMDRTSDGDTTGWEFVPWVDVQVTALGKYDDGDNGLNHSCKVAIFEKSSQKALATVTVDSQSTLRDQFRYEAITPLVLKAGAACVLASECWPEPWRHSASGLERAPEIRFVTLKTNNRGWGYPEQDWRRNSKGVGANFLFLPVSAGSPSTTTP